MFLYNIINFIFRIDKKSPLWKLGPREILKAKFEIIVTLEGIIEPTGSSVQVYTGWSKKKFIL